MGGGCQQVKETPLAQLPKVKIGVQDNLAVALIFLAKEKGYFVDEGVDVEIVRYPSGKKALEGMFNKEVQLATVADVPVALESFNRDDFKIISSISTSDESAWIVARKDRGINQPPDLRGKKVGVQKISGTHFFLSTFLSENFIKENEVEIVYKESAQLVDALVSGEVDAISGRNPFALQSKSALGGENITELFNPDVYSQEYILVALSEVVGGQPNLLDGIVRALARSENFIKNDPNWSKAVLVKALGGDRSEEVEEDFGRFNFRLSLGQALLMSLENIGGWLINRGFVEQKETPNILLFVYESPLESVKPEAVTIIK